MSDTNDKKLTRYSRIGNIIYLDIFKGSKMQSQMPSNNYVQNNDFLSDDNFLSDDELFNMYLQAVQLQALDTDMIIKNKNKIMPLLKVIEMADESSIEYLEANKKIAILTLEKPNILKQIFSFK